jgi:hypothetical protein
MDIEPTDDERKEAAAALRALRVEIEALRRFADLYTVKMPLSSGIGVTDLNPPYIWSGIPIQTSRGGKLR